MRILIFCPNTGALTVEVSMSETKKLANDIIRHISETRNALAVVSLVLDTLFENYDDNRELINELLWFKYDLQGM